MSNAQWWSDTYVMNMMMCRETDPRWPDGVVCSLPIAHPDNLAPSGPHCPSELIMPYRRGPRTTEQLRERMEKGEFVEQDATPTDDSE